MTGDQTLVTRAQFDKLRDLINEIALRETGKLPHRIGKSEDGWHRYVMPGAPFGYAELPPFKYEVQQS